MSTRAQIRFATREAGVSFNEHPEKINAQFYNHSDGYPEGLGVEIAESLTECVNVCGWEIESLTARHSDLEYIYYIWQNLKPHDETWISIFEVILLDPFGNYDDNECIFVGTPEQLINKYKQNTNDDG